MARHRIEVGVDYHQFYLWDPSRTPEAPTDYTEEDCARMVKVADAVVVVQPIRNGAVPVEVVVAETDPGYAAESSDHVVECSLELAGGALQVHECTGGVVLDLDVAPGPYQVRVLFHGLRPEDHDEEEGEDSYTVQLWPGPGRDLSVVRQWPCSAAPRVSAPGTSRAGCTPAGPRR